MRDARFAVSKQSLWVQNNEMCAFSTCLQRNLLQMYLTARIRLGPYQTGIEKRRVETGYGVTAGHQVV